MAALAADVASKGTEGPIDLGSKAADAADTYFLGSVVYADATSGNAKATMGAGDRVLGISPKTQVVAAGDKVEYIVSGRVWVPIAASATAARIMQKLVNDSPTNSDNPADMKMAGSITLAANDAVVGRLRDITSTQMLIEVGPHTGDIYDATAAAWV